MSFTLSQDWSSTNSEEITEMLSGIFLISAPILVAVTALVFR